MNSQTTRRKIIISLCSLLVSLLVAEIILRVIDPLGAWAYTIDSSRIINKNGLYDEDVGYLISPGVYKGRGWAVTIDDKGWRETPASSRISQCTIAIIGDSVTFGWGVDDKDTWPNLVASKYHDVEFINRSLWGYNSSNIRGVVETVDVDGFIYLAIGNDNQPPIVWQPFWQNPTNTTGVSVYVNHALRKSEQGVLWGLFEEDMQVIVSHQPLVFAFPENDVTRWLEGHYPEVVVIDLWTHNISVADSHPDALGHVQIAEQMYPYIDSWLSEACEQ